MNDKKRDRLSWWAFCVLTNAAGLTFLTVGQNWQTAVAVGLLEAYAVGVMLRPAP